MTRMISCLFLGLIAAQANGPAFAQDFNANPTGALIAPRSDVIVFDQPPDGALKSAPMAEGVLQPSGGGATWFGLQPDANAPSGYAPNGTSTSVAGALSVTGYVDIYQGNSLNRWVQIAPTASGTPGGWVQWGAAGQAPQGFTVTGGN